jgi:hypothetical protein
VNCLFSGGADAISWSSAQPHIDRLEPLHPPPLALFAMQDGVPVASAPVGSAQGAAGGDWVACCWCPGGAIEAEVLTDPYRTLGPHGAGVVRRTSC